MAVDLVLKRECAIGPVEGWRKLVPESWALRYVAACLQFRYTCLQLFTLRGVFDQMVGPCNSPQEGKGEDHGKQGGNGRKRENGQKEIAKERRAFFGDSRGI